MLNKNEVDEVLRCIYICQENYGKGNEYLQSAISKLESPQKHAPDESKTFQSEVKDESGEVETK